MKGTAQEQNTILKEIQALGYNVVECPGGEEVSGSYRHCGVALLVRCDDDTYKCFLCDTEFNPSDCSDLVFPDKHNDWQFANT
tara:strand:+ start:285 stop:533 length:249 start_codon:yes stop_codon:yes gene_type:complete